ncbi:imelysin family protein [Dongia soli]|uniref:Imelysin family protein n=1 Tax=Dongia soli TaxID=600628 RepID=A0ABU5EFL0_9PROT|nr:imelysin family protein [Dongia soli]MDY0884982.1 imelysin family protein [Dongia soli]
MKLTRRHSLLSVIATALWQLLPHGARAADKYAAFNAAFARDIAIPSLKTFVATTEAQVKAAAAFKAKPDAAGLDGLHKAFGDVSDAWMAAQLLRFGPLSQEQRMDRVEYWPERRSITDKQLAGLVSAADTSKLAPDVFARASVAVQGLGALERLIYEGDNPLQHFADASPAAAYRLALVAAIADNLHRIANEALADWQALEPKLAKGDQAGLAATPVEATGQIYAGLLTTMQIIADQKIGLPLGKDINLAKPNQAEQWRAGRSLQNIALNLAAMRHAVTGNDAGSFASFLGGKDIEPRLSAAFDDCHKALAAIKQPLPEAVADDKDGRQQVEMFYVKLNLVRDILTQEMPGAIGITLGFNDLDGDGA